MTKIKKKNPCVNDGNKTLYGVMSAWALGHKLCDEIFIYFVVTVAFSFVAYQFQTRSKGVLTPYADHEAE